MEPASLLEEIRFGYGVRAGKPLGGGTVDAERVLAQLSSRRGQSWLRSRCYGVSAKQLSKADLLTFPLSN